MTREEAIVYWEQFLSEIDMMEENNLWSSADDAETQRKATKIAISALRAQEAESDPFERQLKRYEIKKRERPLTLDELREMDGVTDTNIGGKKQCENCGYKFHSQIVSRMPDCNDCVRKNCEYKPRLGEDVRINCPLHMKEGDDHE